MRDRCRARAPASGPASSAIPTRSRLKPEIWVNVPVVERFAQSSPYRLKRSEERQYRIVDERVATAYDVRMPLEPAWYARHTSNDTPMSRIGVLQGTYLAIYVNPICAFWTTEPRLNCLFCTTGQNVGTAEAPVKSVEDVVETCWAAKEESGVTFVHLNGGFQGVHGLEFIKPYVDAIKKRVGLLVGVQLAPERDFRRYERAGGARRRPTVDLHRADGSWLVRVRVPGPGGAAREPLSRSDSRANCRRGQRHHGDDPQRRESARRRAHRRMYVAVVWPIRRHETKAPPQNEKRSLGRRGVSASVGEQRLHAHDVGIRGVRSEQHGARPLAQFLNLRRFRTMELAETRDFPQVTAKKPAAPRVLVVDDEPLIRWSLAETLGDRGYEVVQTSDARSTRSMVGDGSQAFDVVLLDYRLPDSDDLNLLASLRSLSPRAQIILMTAFGTPEVLRGALDLGAYRVIGKPFEMDEVADLVAQARTDSSAA